MIFYSFAYNQMYGTIKTKGRAASMKVRVDKKFEVKVWVKQQDKDIFRMHCFQYHLSMMSVAEKYLKVILSELPDKAIEDVIESRLEKFLRMKSKRDNYEVLGFNLTNAYWQKLAYFAVMYKTTVAKIGSCLFDYAISAYEVQGIEEEIGLEFNQNRKKRVRELGRESFLDRTSDY